MGLLTIDSIETLDYESSKKYQKKLKKAGLVQLLKLYHKNMENKEYKKFPKFGFEIEGNLLNVEIDKNGRKVYGLELDKEYILENKNKTFDATHEFGRWMVELIPLSPFEDFIYSGNLLFSTQSLYKQIITIVKPNNLFLSSTLPPKFGTPAYYPKKDPPMTSSDLELMNVRSNSSYMSDEIINTHPRFPTFTQNVRQRRGEKPQITAPIFPDVHTVMDKVLPGEKVPGEIHLDSFAFGMGMSSLQCTFGVPNLEQSRWLYDQYHIFTPLFVFLDNPARSQRLHSFPQRETLRDRYAVGVDLPVSGRQKQTRKEGRRDPEV